MSTKPPALIGSKAIEAAVKSGNINIAGNVQLEVLELSSESREAQIQHAEALRKYEAQRRARSIAVPTAIEDVKAKLREMGHPVTLFGENHADRRERLREVIAALELSAEELAKVQALINQGPSAQAPMGEVKAGEVPSKQHKEIFYSPACEELIEARKSISSFSFARAQERLQKVKQLSENPELELQERRAISALYATHKDMTLNASQFADDRPLSCVRYAPNGITAATGSFSCSVKLWDINSLNTLGTLRGHQERIMSVAWHPNSYGSSLHGRAILASASADGTCRIWNIAANGDNTSAMDVVGAETGNSNSSSSSSSSNNNTNEPGEMLSLLKGHNSIVTKCAFHPSGNTIATSSADYSWRLWDVETGKELLLQDGHTKECTALAFHPDGSLVLSADAAGVILLWDMRSGQQVQVFQGHIQKVTCSSFNANGFHAATGSIDNMARIWDIRQKKCWYCLPAHSSLISDLNYSKSGELLVTSSFDGTVKVWGARDHRMLSSHSGHLGKVFSCDISEVDEKHIISAGFDRTIKIWAPADEF